MKLLKQTFCVPQPSNCQASSLTGFGTEESKWANSKPFLFFFFHPIHFYKKMADNQIILFRQMLAVYLYEYSCHFSGLVLRL